MIGQSEGQTEKNEQFDVVLDLLTRKPMGVATTGPSFSNFQNKFSQLVDLS